MPKVEPTASGSYRIRFTDPWGRRTIITRRTAADANAAYKRALGDMSRGEYIDPKHLKVKLGDWAEDWLEGARNVGPGGRDIYRQALDHIVPELGQIPLGKVTAGDIDRYLTKMLTTPVGKGVKARPRSATTVHRHYRTLHRMLAVAVERGMLNRNPAAHVKPPKVARGQLAILDAGQVDLLADHMPARYRAWVYVAAYGGLRWSETVGLRRQSVDGARVSVVEQMVRRRDGTWDRCEPKVGSRRVVTLPSFAADELKRHLDSFSQSGPDGLVFCTRTGGPLYGGSWNTVFRRALTNAELPTVRPHDLRHSAASLAIAAGASVKAVQERLGHSSARVTLDVYSHLLPGADEKVAEALDELRATARRKNMRAV